ncbi:mitochondrial import inner membrane translocase subunit tim16-like [Dysidea avara]|uniref:mitochondrial import inner membrane translocase subunit tim16-like n=1 Tax=Dysidea avara TaxID=196820 RepID=UPI00332667B2
MVARWIAQLIVAGGSVVARAFTQALRNEMQAMTAARRAATEQAANRSTDAEETIKANTSTGMSLDEAIKILDVKDIADIDVVKKSYEHLFQVNDKASGGSFYLQSKIVRAKERLEMEMKTDKEKPPSEETTQ